MKKYKVLFVDLDGTLIDTVSGNTFPKGIWDMRIRFDVLDAIKELEPPCVLIVTNWKSHATLTLLAKQDCPLWLQYD